MINFIENSLFFGAALSLAGYEVGLLLKKKFKMALFNPLLIAILCVMGMLQLMQVDYKTYNAGGQYISYLLTPATVCLAVPLYRQLTLLRKNLKAVVIGIVSGVLASMISVLIFCKAVWTFPFGVCYSASEIHYYSHWNGCIGRTWRTCYDHGCSYYYHWCAGKCDCGGSP